MSKSQFRQFALIQFNGKFSELRVSIAEKKVIKIKTRVIKAFLDFSKNKNFGLLEKRIQFLTGNYSIRKSEEGNSLRAGIYYNYLQVTDTDIFNELNQLLKKTIFSKKSKLWRQSWTKFGSKKQANKILFFSWF